MRMRSMLPMTAIACVMVAAPTVVSAQSLGALRERAKKAVVNAAGNGAPAAAGSAVNAPSTSSSRVTYNDRVIEMTSDVVDRFSRALAVEAQVTDSLRAILPTLKEPKVWEDCRTRWTVSAEAKPWIEKMQTLSGSDAYVKFANDMSAAIEKSCGREPGAARSEVQSQLATLPGQRAMQVGSFTRAQYVILRERAAPLCTLEASPAADGGRRVRGSGADIYFVYGAGEVDALRPKCAELMPRISATS